MIEPVIDSNEPRKEQTVDWQVFNYRYNDNKKFNTESMIIDPSTRELVIVTKSDAPPYAFVYKTALDIDPESTGILEDTGIRLLLPKATDATVSAAATFEDTNATTTTIIVCNRIVCFSVDIVDSWKILF